jgi:hypothetical protein
MKCCETCCFFQASTKFCRKNPPQPNEIVKYDKTLTYSKWPVIPLPSKDYCGFWEKSTALEIINESGAMS